MIDVRRARRDRLEQRLDIGRRIVVEHLRIDAAQAAFGIGRGDQLGITLPAVELCLDIVDDGRRPRPDRLKAEQARRRADIVVGVGLGPGQDDIAEPVVEAAIFRQAAAQQYVERVDVRIDEARQNGVA